MDQFFREELASELSNQIRKYYILVLLILLVLDHHILVDVLFVLLRIELAEFSKEVFVNAFVSGTCFILGVLKFDLAKINFFFNVNFEFKCILIQYLL